MLAASVYSPVDRRYVMKVIVSTFKPHLSRIRTFVFSSFFPGNRFFLHHFIFHFRHDEQIDCECFLVDAFNVVLKPLEVIPLHTAFKSGIQVQFSTCLFTLFSHSVFELLALKWKMDSVEVAETKRPYLLSIRKKNCMFS